MECICTINRMIIKISMKYTDFISSKKIHPEEEEASNFHQDSSDHIRRSLIFVLISSWKNWFIALRYYQFSLQIDQN